MNIKFLFMIFCLLLSSVGVSGQSAFAETILVETVSGTTTSTSTLTVPGPASGGIVIEEQISNLLQSITESVAYFNKEVVINSPSQGNLWIQDAIFGASPGIETPLVDVNIESVQNISCSLTMNHSIGDSGGEVRALQVFLNSIPETRLADEGAGSPGEETDYFGTATLSGVLRFQELYREEILVSNNLTVPTGYWGPASRAMAHALQGCN